MKYIGPILLFLVFTSPLTFILSGCQWKPDGGGTSTRAEAGSSWVITKVGEPSPTESEVKPTPPATYDPLRVPTEDDPYAPPARVTLPPSNPPPVNTELLSNGEVCTDGSCAAQGGSGGGWRPFKRLRGRR